MTIARAPSRRIAYYRQSALGTIADSNAAAVTARRSSTTLGLTRDTFESAEKRFDQQTADNGLGTHRVTGNLEGEMFVGAFEELIESLVRRDYTAVSTINAASGDGFTFVASTGVLTRAAGGGESFLTDGITELMIVRPGALHASIDSKNAIVTAVTATAITLKFLDGTTGTDVAVADTNATLTIPGKRTFAPLTGHTADTYTIEEYFADLDKSTVYKNVKVGSLALSQAPNSFATASFGLTGTGETTDYSASSAPYFTSPNAAGTSRGYRSVGTFVMVNGVVIGTATQVNLNVDKSLEAPAVVGSLYSPDVFEGRTIAATLDLTVFLEDMSYRDILRQETEIKIATVLQAVGSSDFFAVALPRAKITAHSIDDPDTGLQQSISLMGLLPAAASGITQSTIIFQDSNAS